MTSTAKTNPGVRLLNRIAEDRRGGSAVEFGLIAPMMLAGLLGVVDVGGAVNERIKLDAILRAGALVAMTDPGAAAVSDTLSVVDAGQGATDQRASLTLDVQRYCACPGDTGATVACSTTCPGAQPTAIFYRLSTGTTYDGMVLPRISLGAESRVRIR
ncbi:TadE/TadG family type IV pilus assembly protein [Palleronia rufa]|uniref:TadE/TadG family type IV pilus assembly protein n=1 Tax=Palleronia rufa TaxID=1530186 RepID=UPI0009DEEEC0|nr:TadE/TadG family type IV pilus assembly protein [Palleronia rufa]